MPKFEMTSPIKCLTGEQSQDLLTMEGVNSELYPFIHMSYPAAWQSKTISDWPINKMLFKSWITLFGVMPIDVHRFEFTEVHKQGFKERSSSLFNRTWHHERCIIASGKYTLVRDSVHYTAKIKCLGRLMKPVYQSIFKHRHRRLRAKYGPKLGSKW